jgi:hypothetical protein
LGKAPLSAKWAILLLGLLTACSDQGGLTGLGSADARALETFSLLPGSLLTSSQNLPLAVSGSLPFDVARVTLTNAQGGALWSNDYPADAMNSATLTPVLWNSLESNPAFTPTLNLNFNFLLNGTTQLVLNVPFYLLNAPPTPSLTTLPSEAELDSTYLCQLSPLSMPNAWVIWQVNGQTVDQGPWSGHLKWRGSTGKTPGVLQVVAQGYPDPPQTIPLPPPAFTVTTNVVVSAHPSLQSNELGPESSYSELYHFRGNLKDSVSGEVLRISSGPPVWDDPWGVFTAEAGPLTRWVSEKPLTHGATGPFSWEATLAIPALLKSEVLLLCPDSQGNPVLEVGIDALRHPYLRVEDNSKTWTAQASRALGTDPVNLVFSVFPGNKGWRVEWFQDGQRDGESFLSGLTTPPSSLPAKSTLWVGSAFWSEAGVYTTDKQGRSNADPDILLRAMQARYGADLLLAEGFDGAWPDPGWVETGKHLTWPPILEAKEVLKSPAVSVGAGVWQVHLSASGRADVQAVDENGTVLWSQTFDPQNDTLTWDRRQNTQQELHFLVINPDIPDLALDQIVLFRQND